MSTVPLSTLTQALCDLLTEAYDGPPDPSITWFVDNEPDSGILGAIRNISAAEASRPVDGSGVPGSTIAANVEHLRWSLANANGAMRGEPYQFNWSESWNTLEADKTKWNALRKDLRREYLTLRDAVRAAPDLQDEYLLGVLALIPHAAFHLGLLRQMIERVRQAGPAADAGLPEGLSQPALRALSGRGIHRLEQLAAFREADILKMHGVGPKAIQLLSRALAARGLSFKP
jgi:hypothetical protein